MPSNYSPYILVLTINKNPSLKISSEGFCKYYLIWSDLIVDDQL